MTTALLLPQTVRNRVSVLRDEGNVAAVCKSTPSTGKHRAPISREDRRNVAAVGLLPRGTLERRAPGSLEDGAGSS